MMLMHGTVGQVGSIKGFQTKIPFKTTEEVDARIR